MRTTNKINDLENMRAIVGSWGNLDKKRLNYTLKFAGKKILDVGCATGSYVKYLNNNGFDAFGCDILSSPSWTGKMENKFKVADIYHLPYDGKSFDTILLFETLEHIDKPESAIKELSRITSGNLILSVPNCDQPEEFKASGLALHHWIDRTHVQFFNKSSILKILKNNGFKIDDVMFVDPIMPETLMLRAWNLPLKLAVIIGKLCQLIPLRKKYYLSILVVANK